VKSYYKTKLISLIIIATLSCTDSPKKYFKKAKEFDENGDYTRAVIYYQRVFELYPDSDLAPESLLRAGKISRIYLMKPRTSLNLLNAIIFNYPNSKFYIQAQKEIADIWMDDLRNYEMAVTEYSKLIQLNPPVEILQDARFRIVRCFEHSGNYDQALIELRGLLNSGELQQELKEKAEFELYVILYIKKNLNESIRGFQEFITKYSNSELIPDAKFYLASAYADKNDFQQALAILNEIKDTYRNPEAIQAKVKGIEVRMKKIKR